MWSSQIPDISCKFQIMRTLPLWSWAHFGNTPAGSTFKVPSWHLSNQSPSTLNPRSHVTVTDDPSITSFGNINPRSILIAWQISESIGHILFWNDLDNEHLSISFYDSKFESQNLICHVKVPEYVINFVRKSGTWGFSRKHFHFANCRGHFFGISFKFLPQFYISCMYYSAFNSIRISSCYIFNCTTQRVVEIYLQMLLFLFPNLTITLYAILMGIYKRIISNETKISTTISL